ncbi:AAA family ATPase [Labrys portucalensis]|uniref:AAA family ATPase n=1 Tax=Labrys neptuniae TaxID=376174 RepID=A0ABV6ZS44_9HYPH
MEKTGNTQSRLITIRGNSGTGKSTLALAIRQALPRGVVIIGQDLLRRNILHVPDKKTSPTADYIDLSARFALDRGLHVIIEGILYDEVYGDMLRALIASHQGVTRCYRFKIPFEETLNRHTTKSNAGDFGEAEMRRWWRDDDCLFGIDETIIGPDQALAESVLQVITDCGWQPLATCAVFKGNGAK